MSKLNTLCFDVMTMDHLVLLSDISTELNIIITGPTGENQPFTVDMKWTPISVNTDEEYDFVPISNEALFAIAYDKADITFVETADIYGNRFEKTFHSNGGFTVKYLLDCVLEFEKIARVRSQRIDDIDQHYVFFEGLEERSDGMFDVCWGS